MDCICDHMQAVLEDWILKQRDSAAKQRIQNLVVNVPPGSSKSRILSVYAPAWMWTRCPEWRVILFSANPRVAMRDSVYSRDVILSQWYQDTFKPEWKMSADVNGKGLFRNTRGGYRQSQGITSKIVGDRADCILVDDPNDPKEIFSDVSRESVNNNWDWAIANRLNDLRCSTRIGIQQRLHENDWTGHVTRQGGWEHVFIPQEFEPPRRFTTALGWTDPREAEGELMFSERFTPEVLASEKNRLGSLGYAGQHQQSAAPAEGGWFKKQWFKYWSIAHEDLITLFHGDRTEVVDLSKCRFFATQDVADSTKTAADFTVIATWCVTPNADLLLMDCIRDRMEDPDAIQCVVNLFEQWEQNGFRIDYIATEENGVGLPRIQHLQRKGVPVKPIRVSTDKKSRAMTAIIRCEAGKLFWPQPRSAPWMHDWESEHLLFPNSTYFDQVDSTSLAALEVFSGTFAQLRPGPVMSLRGAAVKTSMSDKMGHNAPQTGTGTNRPRASDATGSRQRQTTANPMGGYLGGTSVGNATRRKPFGRQ